MPIPKVSVIIPVYNAEKYLYRCLESLFAQTLAEIEYIFIDDASPDNSFAILSEWIEQNDRKNQVKIIRHACNMGVSQSRQDGMNVATGEFIIHCDPDDWISENLYRKMYDKAVRENLDVVVCGITYVDGGIATIDIPSIAISRPERLKELIDGRIHGSLCNKLVRKSYLDSLGIRLDESIPLWEDLYISIYMMMETDKIATVNDESYFYRRDNMGSATRNRTKEMIYAQINVTSKLIDYFTLRNEYSLYESQLVHLVFSAKGGLLFDKAGYDTDGWRSTLKSFNKKFINLEIPAWHKFIYTLTILHIDFLTKIYVLRPSWLLTIYKRFKH